MYCLVVKAEFVFSLFCFISKKLTKFGLVSKSIFCYFKRNMNKSFWPPFFRISKLIWLRWRNGSPNYLDVNICDRLVFEMNYLLPGLWLKVLLYVSKWLAICGFLFINLNLYKEMLSIILWGELHIKLLMCLILALICVVLITDSCIVIF